MCWPRSRTLTLCFWNSLEGSGMKKAYDLNGRNAIVTGGARGIGAAAALCLAREGANIVVADMTDATETVKRVEAMGRKAMAVKTDVSVKSDVHRMVGQSIERFGHIDILVNNAGVVHRDSLLDTSEETWDRVVSIVLRGTFFCIQAVYPH